MKKFESEKVEKARAGINMSGRILGVFIVIFFLGWYCTHPEYYRAETFSLQAVFSVSRSYMVMLISALMMTVCVTPNELPDRINRILGWIWFFAAPFAVYFSLYYMNAEKYHIYFTKLNPIAVAFTFYFLFLAVIILLLITGSVRFSVIILAAAVGILGIANRFVISFRGMALSGADLFSVKTAMTVASNYTYKIIWDIYAEAALTVIICMISLKIRGFRPLGWKLRTLVLCIWLTFASVFYYVCCKTSYLEDHDIRTWGFTHQLRYKQYDMLFTTLLTVFYLAVDKPDGYSLDKVRELGQNYIPEGDGEKENGQAASGGEEKNRGTASEEAGDEKTPDVIVVMNESFADYTEIGKGIAYSEDPLPFFHSLQENTIRGNAYVSIFGANTPNSEYEFLTGNTMGFLPPTSVGFNLFVRGEMPSLASQFKAEGYSTLAIHPYRGTNYRRNIVYPQIGFDTYYDRSDFSVPSYIRQYISDQSLAERIIQEYEQKKAAGEKLFSWNVTVQNHGGYTRSNTKNLDTAIQALPEGLNALEVNQHANLVRESDRALEYLVNYFSQQEDPVILIMFGDHQPNLGDNTYQYLIGNEEELTSEELMEKYKVPFICWTNYDIREEYIEKTSLNYLYSILADRLELPMTGYQQYLLELSQEIPVLAAGGYWTRDGEFYELEDKTSPYYEQINNYNILEYNYIFGKKNRYMELLS